MVGDSSGGWILDLEECFFSRRQAARRQPSHRDDPSGCLRTSYEEYEAPIEEK
jgi:hypothetical protein